MAPILLALCGKIPAHVEHMIIALQPEYEIIHACVNAAPALAELPPLLSGVDPPPQPVSGQGTNYENPNPKNGKDIQAIIVGGGFTADEFDAIREACDNVKGPLPYFRTDASKRPPGMGSGPPPAGVLRERATKVMSEKWTENGWESGVHLF